MPPPEERTTALADHLRHLFLILSAKNSAFVISELEKLQTEAGGALTSTLESSREALCASSNDSNLASTIVDRLLHGTSDRSLTDALLALEGAETEPAAFASVLGQLAPAMRHPEREVARALSTMTRTPATGWNVASVMVGIRQAFPRLDPIRVVNELDSPAFFVDDIKGAELLMTALHYLFPENFSAAFPISLLWTPWTNIRGQLSLIRHVVQLPGELFNPSAFAGRRIISVEDFPTANSSLRNLVVSLAAQTWNCFELFEFVSRLVDTEFFDEVRPIFELASKQSTELLCIAMAMLNPPWNSILKEILVKLTCGFLLGHPSSAAVLPRIWAVNPAVVVVCMVEMHRRDATCLSRLLDVAQELKILTMILDAKPYAFSIDLAALASRRQHLNLDKWLADSIRDKKELFVRACLEFLLEKLTLQMQRQERMSTPPFIPLSSDVLNIFLRVLQSNLATLPPDCVEQFHELQSFLGPSATRPSADISFFGYGGGQSGEGTFPADIENEVNGYFDRLFSGQIDVLSLIGVFRRLKESQNVKDQQLFACALNDLFDEYRFLSKYPEHELAITATLFGTLIQYHLVSFVPLGVALRYVLESLRKPFGHKLFKFGLQALTQFRDRLAEWPQYCTHLLQIPHLVQSSPELATFLRQCLMMAVPASSGMGVNAAFSTVGRPEGAEDGIEAVQRAEIQPPRPGGQESSLTTLNITSLLDASGRKIAIPPHDQTRDKILFIMNNLSSSNMQAKVGELTLLLQEEYYPWLAQYLVVNRASVEPNYHPSYLELIDRLGLPVLTEQVLDETYTNVDILIRSSKAMTSSSERGLLKNLGMWLGALTLARDQPILLRDISLKDILLEAYEAGRLIVVIPFVCKVMEQCSHSRAFRPPNPWLMAIMRLLVELYHSADLKLNLKFEVEVLCKHLELDLNDIKPSNFIRIRSVRAIPPTVATKEEAVQSSRSQQPPLRMPTFGSRGGPSDERGITLSGLSSHVQLNPRITAIQAHPVLRKIILLAIEYAVREMLPSAVERSVSIASVTTRAMIMKDFADINDAEVIQSSAVRMIQSLTSGLALATCKEPMRTAISSNIRSYLQLASQSTLLSEQAIQMVAEDNLDVACAYVEKASMEKAAAEIMSYLAIELEGRPEQDVEQQRMPDFVKVYESFGKTSRFPGPASSSLAVPIQPVSASEYDRLIASLRALSMNPTRGEEPDSPAFEEDESTIIPMTIEKFLALFGNIDRLIPVISATATALAQLAPGHELRLLMKQIILLASSSPAHRDEVCLLMSQKIMQALYRTDSTLYADVCILLLVKIFELSSKVSREVTTWVVYADDERKYNVLATAALFASSLVYVLDYDAQLAKHVESGRDNAVRFAIQLIRRCVFDDPAIAAPYDFVYSFEALGKLHQHDARPDVAQVLEDVRQRVKALQAQPRSLKDQITLCFNDWLRLSQYPTVSDKLLSSFTILLYQREFLKGAEGIGEFIRICLDLSMDMFRRQHNAPAILAYRSIDGLGKLIACLVRWHPGDSSEEYGVKRADIISTVLALSGASLIERLDQQEMEALKPFSRFFIALSTELSNVERYLDGPLNDEIVEIFGEFYLSLSPRRMPQLAFVWLELISHRSFMSRLLFSPENTGWASLAQLLTEYLLFVAPWLCQCDLSEPIRTVYRGLLKVLLVLLHDVPDFLAAYCHELCDYIPASSIQLRNIILSAFPRGIVLPDPFRSDFQVDLLKEIHLPPYILCDPAEAVNVCGLRESLENFMMNENRVGLLGDIKDAISKPSSRQADDAPYNVALINSVVYVCGQHGMQQWRKDSMTSGKDNAAIKVLLYLLAELDNHGRYLVLNAIANHLRYPNSHTHYFSCVLLFLFAEGTSDMVKEQIARVLLERLIVNRPHPWGILITFIELIKNPAYRFWDCGFTHMAPDIERLLESAARSCMLPGPSPKDHE